MIANQLVPEAKAAEMGLDQYTDDGGHQAGAAGALSAVGCPMPTDCSLKVQTRKGQFRGKLCAITGRKRHPLETAEEIMLQSYQGTPSGYMEVNYR